MGSVYSTSVWTSSSSSTSVTSISLEADSLPPSSSPSSPSPNSDKNGTSTPSSNSSEEVISLRQKNIEVIHLPVPRDSIQETLLSKAAKFSLESGSSFEFTPEQVLQCAEMSCAAYTGGDNCPFLQRIRQEGKFEIIDETLPNGVERFLLIKPTLPMAEETGAVQTLALRGTMGWRDIINDIDFKSVYDPTFDLHFHAGFLNATMAVLPEAIKQLDRRIPVVLTGHSLGGAVAVILGFFLKKQGFKIRQCVTFGQPKVTSADDAHVLDVLVPALRMVNEGDFVTALPPTSILGIHVNYAHFGRELVLTKEGIADLVEEPSSSLQDVQDRWYRRCLAAIGGMVPAAKVDIQQLESDVLFSEHRILLYISRIQTWVKQQSKALLHHAAQEAAEFARKHYNKYEIAAENADLL